MTNNNWQAYAAEFLGTLGFVAVGAGAVVALDAGADYGLLGVALAQGLALAALIYGLGRVSGAHVNPAVTIGFWLARRLATAKTIGYIIAQLMGAVVGAYIVRTVFPAAAALSGVGMPELRPGISFSGAVLVEALFTFFLVWIVLATTQERETAAHTGLAAGFIVAAGILIAGPATGGVFNPARAFGPAVVSNVWTNYSVWWLGPLGGAVLASIIWRVVSRGHREAATI